ncbi:hypothetical protein M0805_004437 [Coniferiporia weirii]|nr:hypothetical protein M0805_004437 [Coniferiporia weirii]
MAQARNATQLAPVGHAIGTVWVLEGQDREGGFVFALRQLLHTLPKDVTPKRLFGVADFGIRTFIRDEKTNELKKKLALEQIPKLRVFTCQKMLDNYQRLSESEGPSQLCSSVRDALCGLLNAYRMGYVHREIQPDSIFALRYANEHTDTRGLMLSKDGKSIEGEPRECSGFLYDFTQCYRIEGKDKGITGDTEIFTRFVSTPVIILRGREGITPSPIYDLESFLWVILTVATEIIVDHLMGKRTIKIDCPDLESDSESASGDEGNSGVDAEGKITEPKADRETEMDIEDDADVKDRDVPKSADNSIERKTEAMTLEGDKMDTDDSVPEAQAETIVGIETNEGGKEKDGKDKTNAGIQDEQESNKRKRSDTTTTEEIRRAKGKQRAVAEGESGIKADNTDNGGISAPRAPASGSGGEGSGENIPHPSRSSSPEPSIAFEEDPQALDLYNMLRVAKTTEAVVCIREMLLKSLDKMIGGSTNLGPFRPLLCALRAVAAEYYEKSVSMLENDKNAEFSKDEVEEAFARYLDAFDKNHPTENHWMYMQEHASSGFYFKGRSIFPGFRLARVVDARQHTRRRPLIDMGGGGQYPYPKEVWSPAGGWWTRPSNWKSNTAIAFGGILLVTYSAWQLSASREWRHNAPAKPIPSMLWSKQYEQQRANSREVKDAH